MSVRYARLLVLGLWAAAASSSAQAPPSYSARLAFVPVSAAELDLVSGQGSATAELSGASLSIDGAFEGLPAPVARASLRRGITAGAGGPLLAELEANGEMQGTFEGEVALDDDDLAALFAGRLYVQVHVERGGLPPDGAVLRGWLLPDPGTLGESAAAPAP